MFGVDGGGNTSLGPSLPFGMIKAGPDIGDKKGNAGWKAKGRFTYPATEATNILFDKVRISFVSEAQAKGNVAGSTYTEVRPGLPPLQQACFLTCFSGPGQERPMPGPTN
jgi:putative alpha-1,2-mannosidase